jgi:hypothetical protein
MRRALGLLTALYSMTFGVAVLLHLGADVPLGFTVLEEPQRPIAVIVEGVVGLALAVGAFAVFTRRSWAWAVVTGGTPSRSSGSCGAWWPSLPAVVPRLNSTTRIPGDGGALSREPDPVAHTARAGFTGT